MDSGQQVYKDVMNLIRNKLINARLDSGLSQAKASELIGISRKALSNIENGKTEPRLFTYLQLMNLYEEWRDKQ